MNISSNVSFKARFEPNENLKQVYIYAINNGKIDSLLLAMKKLKEKNDDVVLSLDQFGYSKSGNTCFTDIIKIGYDNPDMADEFIPIKNMGNRFTYVDEKYKDPLEHAYQIIRKLSKNPKVYNRLISR